MRKYKSAAATTVAKTTPQSASAARLGVGSEYRAAKKPKKKAAATVRKTLTTTINAAEVDAAAFENSEVKSAVVDKVAVETSDTWGRGGWAWERQ